MKGFIALVAVICVLGGAYFYLTQNGMSVAIIASEPELPAIDRSGTVLVETSLDENTGKPQILKAELIAENPEQLIFNVTYLYPDYAEDGKYNISIHPNNSSWSYSMNTLEQGTHTLPITVSLRVKNGQDTAASDILHFYISHAQDNKHIGKVFEQALPFKKDWKKTGH